VRRRTRHIPSIHPIYEQTLPLLPLLPTTPVFVMASAYPADTSNGAVVRYIPLTTTFTPTQGCSRLFRLNGPSLVAYDPGYGLDIDKRVVCQPSAVTSWWEQARLGVGDTDHTAVSLGPLICPDQWATVASSVKDESSTLHMCCPKSVDLIITLVWTSADLGS